MLSLFPDKRLNSINLTILQESRYNIMARSDEAHSVQVSIIRSGRLGRLNADIRLHHVKEENYGQRSDNHFTNRV